jgi:hypothetical protein
MTDRDWCIMKCIDKRIMPTKEDLDNFCINKTGIFTNIKSSNKDARKQAFYDVFRQSA